MVGQSQILVLFIFIAIIADFKTFGQSSRNRKNRQDESVNFSFGRELGSLRSAAEDNIHKSATGSGRDLDLKLPHFAPIEKWFGGFDFERRNHPALKSFVKFALNFIGRTSTDPKLVAEAKKQGKFQDEVPMSTPFPCDTSNGRSPTRPSDVHHLRPGDIDVIAALGDSLTAGNGLAGSSFRHSMLTNRGLSAFVGGQGTWRQYWTLPNMLKEFNPRLRGYSTGDTLYYEMHHNQQLNMAEAGAVMSDLPDMARALKKKMVNLKVDMDNDWKMVSVFMGGVDFCLDLCFWKRPQDGPATAERAIRDALDYLMENFPRTIVIFVTYLDIGEVVHGLKFEGECARHLTPPCPCVFGKSFESIQTEYLRLIKQILDVQSKVANDPKYKSKPDFIVSVHEEVRKYGTLLTPKLPEKDGKVLSDQRYVSSDCFHLSQRGHSLFAINLWNSLFTERNETFVPNAVGIASEVICPSKENPFLHV